MATPTRDDVWLCLHLYEQRREPVLRAAREWLIEFNPRKFSEIARVMQGKEGPEANRYWRQATSYWEMISALMMSGGVSPEARDLFVKTSREFFLVYSKIAPFLAEFRSTYRPTAFQQLEAFCKSLPDYDATLAFFTKMLGEIRERTARAKKPRAAKKRPAAKKRKRA